MVLINGLAEQSESWFRNAPTWSKHYNVRIPEVLVYNGEALHRHVRAGGAVTVDYLADRLGVYLDEFTQSPPYHLVASSLGCQVALTYAARNPEKVRSLTLLAPSGFHGDENLPMMEGVRRSNYEQLVSSVFHNKRFATRALVKGIEEKFQDRVWKRGVLATLRGTVGHSVSDLLDKVEHRTLVIWGAEDKILADVEGSIRAAERLANGTQVVIPNCGHAPQIEASRLVNKLVLRHLKGSPRPFPSSVRVVENSRTRLTAGAGSEAEPEPEPASEPQTSVVGAAPSLV